MTSGIRDQGSGIRDQESDEAPALAVPSPSDGRQAGAGVCFPLFLREGEAVHLSGAERRKLP
jgi:hypothetical protein